MNYSCGWSGNRGPRTLAAACPKTAPSGMSPLTTVPGETTAETPTRLPPRTTHRAVIHAPSSIRTGLVMSAMSRRKAWDPVVTNVPCEITVSQPMVSRSWLCNQTSSPIQLRSPMIRFQGDLTRRRGLRTTPRPTRAPKATKTARRRRELICQGLLTRRSSAALHAYTFQTGAPHVSLAPGAAERSITRGRDTGRGYGSPLERRSSPRRATTGDQDA